MKLGIPTIEGDVDLIRDWGRIITRLKEEKTNNLLITVKKNVLGTISCRPKRDKLLEQTASQHHSDGTLHCYKMSDTGVSRTLFDAYRDQERIKNILGE